MIHAPASPTVVVGPSTVTVSWAAAAQAGTFDVAGYEVLADLDAAPDAQMWGPSTICETDAATFTCTAAVKAGRAYQIWVQALDVEGNGTDVTPITSGVVPAPAVPATVPAKNGDLTVTGAGTGAVAPGKKLTVSGSGYAPGTSVDVVIYSAPQVLTTVVADALGNFSVEVTVPAGLAAGNHTLVASGVDANGVARYVTVPVTVAADGTAAIAATTGGGRTLAATGADVAVPAIAGLATLGLGAGLIVAARRRRTAA